MQAGGRSNDELARVLANAAYARAAAGLVAGIEECEEDLSLMELQKVALVRSIMAHFDGFQDELRELILSAESLKTDSLDDWSEWFRRSSPASLQIEADQDE